MRSMVEGACLLSGRRTCPYFNSSISAIAAAGARILPS
jgi:hypothetical protein